MKEEKGSMKEEKGRMTSRKRKTDSMVRKRAKGDEDCFKFNSSNSFYFVLLCIKREKMPMVNIFKICNKNNQNTFTKFGHELYEERKG